MVVFGNELSGIGFIAAIWLVEKVVLRLGGSPVVANLLTGILLGPALADMVPHVEAWKLIGKLGVLLLIVDGTLSINLRTVKEVGVRAFFAAAAGVAGPVALCMLFVTGVFGRGWKTGLATGAAIAPTSLGFSAKLLQESNQLTTPLGQLICVTAVMDDVLSLCLLAELQVVKGGDDGVGNATVLDGNATAAPSADPTTWDYLRPAVASLGSIVVGAVLALYIMPAVIPVLIECVGRSLRGKHRRYFCVFLIFATSTGFAFLSAYAGSSDLLGCFCGALPFSHFPEFTEAWAASGVAPLCNWGGRIFFAGTIGFGVPKVGTGAGGLLEVEAVWRGIVLGLCGVVGKLLLAVFASPLTGLNAMLFGWAMQGRGEFSFILADESANDKLFEEKTSDYPAVIWGLLICCISAPFAFRLALAYAPPPPEEGAEQPPPEPHTTEPAVPAAPPLPAAVAGCPHKVLKSPTFTVTMDQHGVPQYYDL